MLGKCFESVDMNDEESLVANSDLVAEVVDNEEEKPETKKRTNIKGK